jgi:hypothetical protein
MFQMVLILGTDHRFQMRCPDFTEFQHQQFVSYVVATARAYKVAAIIEENNPQAVAEANVAESTIRTIARDLGIKHLYCDPDRETRTALGIRQENEIRISGFLEGAIESVIQQRVDESMRIRERYWLARLQQFNTWPTLFICGANHALPFLDLLRKEKVDTILVAQDWGA